jgi:hypothetical protein
LDDRTRSTYRTRTAPKPIEEPGLHTSGKVDGIAVKLFTGPDHGMPVEEVATAAWLRLAFRFDIGLGFARGCRGSPADDRMVPVIGIGSHGAGRLHGRWV